MKQREPRPRGDWARRRACVCLAANTSLLWAPGVPLGLAVLAIAQMGVRLVFFLRITTGPDNSNNVLERHVNFLMFLS
jgi:heme/copper-type cytochrome/quinol oxidase subunit 4